MKKICFLFFLVNLRCNAAIVNLNDFRLVRSPHSKVRKDGQEKPALVWKVMHDLEVSHLKDRDALQVFKDLIFKSTEYHSAFNDSDFIRLIENHLENTYNFDLADALARITGKARGIVALSLIFKSCDLFRYNLSARFLAEFESQIYALDLYEANKKEIESGVGYLLLTAAPTVEKLILNQISKPPLSTEDLEERFDLLDFWRQFVKVGGGISPYIKTIAQSRALAVSSIEHHDFLEKIEDLIFEAPHSFMNMAKILLLETPRQDRLISDFILTEPDLRHDLEKRIIYETHSRERSVLFKALNRSTLVSFGHHESDLSDALRAEMLIFAPDYYFRFIQRSNSSNRDLKRAEELNVAVKYSSPVKDEVFVEPLNISKPGLYKMAFLSQAYFAAIRDSRFNRNLQAQAISLLTDPTQTGVYREGLSLTLVDYIKLSHKELHLDEQMILQLAQTTGQNRILGILLAAEFSGPFQRVQDILFPHLDDPMLTRKLFQNLSRQSTKSHHLRERLVTWYLQQGSRQKVLESLAPELFASPCKIILLKTKTTKPQLKR